MTVCSICSICTLIIVNEHKLECSHIFCKECIDIWLKIKQTCPVCRTVIKMEFPILQNDIVTYTLPPNIVHVMDMNIIIGSSFPLKFSN